MDVDAQKRAAAARAIEFVRPGMRLGLGSGSTARHFVELLAERVRAGLDIIGVPTSEATRNDAERLGVPLTSLDETPELDLTVDGADEIGPDLSLIKGGGGALLREKIVVAAADRFVVVAETSKQVDRLGATRGIPVEVVRFGWRDTRARLLTLVESAELRRGDDGEPYVTDEGHYILDCAPRATGAMADLAAAVKAMPGVVEHGLFLTEASLALLGTPDGEVERIES